MAENSKKDEKLLETALERFKQAQDAESDIRERALEDVKFANDDQWDQQTLQERRGRPSLVVNKVAGTLKQIRGDQRRSRPAIKVRPVDSSSDPEVAKIFNGLIKNVEYNSGADAAYDTAFDQAIEGGFGYFRIITDYAHEDTFEQDIFIRRITNPFSVHLDQSYNEADASDLKWAFISEVLDKEDFENKYPKAGANDWLSGRGDEQSDWFTEDGVRVAEYWYKEPCQKTLYQLEGGDVISDKLIEEKGHEIKDFADGKALILFSDETDETDGKIPQGVFQIENERTVDTHKVMWAKLTETEVLEGPQEWSGRYIPIVLVQGEEAYINGKRHLKSAHRHARDAQRVYNWMVSTAVETISMAPKQPWVLTPEQIEGYENQWNVAHRRPMPYLLYNNMPNQQAPSRLGGSTPDSGATNERMQAADDIKATTGIYDASLGAQGNEKSGVAIQARQTQGDMSTFVFMDNLVRSIRHAGRILVDLIPKVYDSERMVRILGPDGTEQFVELNKTVTDPESGTVQTLNDVTQGKYDVVVDTGPAFATQRAEAAKCMLDFVKAMPQMAPHLMDLIAKHMDWPGADEIYERLQQIQQQQGQEQQDPQQQLELQEKQLDVEGKKLELQKAQFSLQGDQTELRGKHLDNVKTMQEVAGKADELDMKNEEHILKIAQAAAENALKFVQQSGQQNTRPQQGAKSSQRGTQK